MSIAKKVIEFNQQVIGIPQRSRRILDPDEYEWLLGTLSEELGELDEAYEQYNFIGQVDAVIDLIYFAIGGLYRMGLTAEQIDQAFDIVHLCNMAKAKGKKERAVQNELDAVKPEDWVSPEAQLRKLLLG